jgi:pyridoxamine 5'-phosphate oxidase
MNIIILDLIKIELAHGLRTSQNNLESREVFLKKIAEFEKKYPDTNNVPRPPHWSGWRILPKEIEFWLDGEGRIHERLNYINQKGKWEKEILYP